MQKIMKTFCLLVSMLVLFQVTPAKADLVCDAIRSACRQAGVSEWIKKEINGGQLLVNPFTAGEGVRGMSEISIFRTELLNDLQNAGITIYSPLTATAPANTLKGEISILRSRASLTSKLVLTLGKSATKEVVVKDQGVAAVLAGTTIVTEGQDGKDLIVEQNDAVNSSGVRMSQGEAGTAINDTTLPGSPYEVAVLGKDGQRRNFKSVNLVNAKDLVVQRRFICEFKQGEEFELFVKNCRGKDKGDVAVEILIDGISMFSLWEDESVKRPGYIQLAGGDEFIIKGWMRYLQKNGSQEGNTLSFRAGKYNDSVRAKYGISESDTVGGGIGTITLVFRNIRQPGEVLAGEKESGIGAGSVTTTACESVESHPAKEVNQVVTITYTVAP